ncbi:MAG: ABC transporter substrate-binding protein [Proteobacteria bacterium]|nr:ABC transporter substrate-binding protein [Pseudomonadota bacterium]
MSLRKLLLGAIAAIGLTATAALAEPKTVTLWHIYNFESDMIHYGIKAFNESQSEYRIEPRLVPYTNINPELIKAIATGTPPDLTVINDPVVASFSSQGQLTDLTDRIAKSKIINLDVYYKGPLASSQWKGRRYSVAREVNALALYYNADMFRAKGLDPDKPPKTWSEVVAAAEKLRDPAKGVYGIGFCAHSSEQAVFQWLPFLWQAGGSIDKLDQPEATQALQLWVDLVQKGLASRDVINQQQREVTSTFIAGGSAMAVGGPWELPNLQKDAKFDWRVAVLPVKDDKNIKASSLGGFHFAIPKGAKEVDGAFKVIEFMSNATLFNEGWKAGLLAPRSDIELKDPQWPQAYGVFHEQIKTAIQRGPHPQWPDLSRPIQIAIQEALTGTKPANVALQEAAKKIQPILAKTPL